MIMERYGVDAVQAFELLRKLSQDSNVPLIQDCDRPGDGGRGEVGLACAPRIRL